MFSIERLFEYFSDSSGESISITPLSTAPLEKNLPVNSSPAKEIPIASAPASIERDHNQNLVQSSLYELCLHQVLELYIFVAFFPSYV